MKFNSSSNALASQRRISQAAPLHAGSSPMETTRYIAIPRDAVRIRKTNERLNSDQGALVHKSIQMQRRSFKENPSCSVKDDGIFRRGGGGSLFCREKTESLNRLRQEMEASLDNNKTYFWWKKPPKQAESTEGGSDRQPPPSDRE